VVVVNRLAVFAATFGISLGVAAEEVALLRVGLAFREVDFVLNDIDQGVNLRGVDVLRGVTQGSEDKGSVGGGEGEVDHRMMMVTGERMTRFFVQSNFFSFFFGI